jgi:hypothetical protein
LYLLDHVRDVHADEVHTPDYAGRRRSLGPLDRRPARHSQRFVQSGQHDRLVVREEPPHDRSGLQVEDGQGASTVDAPHHHAPLLRGQSTPAGGCGGASSRRARAGCSTASRTASSARRWTRTRTTTETRPSGSSSSRTYSTGSGRTTGGPWVGRSSTPARSRCNAGRPLTPATPCGAPRHDRSPSR